jgi:RHS repeat-associated protein
MAVQIIKANTVQIMDYYPFGLMWEKQDVTSTDNLKWHHGKELQENEFAQQGKSLDLEDFGARIYDPILGRWWSVDPMAEQRNWLSPYNFVQNNPIVRVDPTGALDDWVQDPLGNIRWDKDANSQETTKPGDTYLGKTLTFVFNSYIDEELWDGPSLGCLIDPTGDKLTSTITITGEENANGELTAISGTSTSEVGPTPVGSARMYYPGEGGSNNMFNIVSTSTGIAALFEQHASVSPSEEVGLNSLGYRVVDVAQKLLISYNSSNSKLSVNAFTGVFPSATLTMNNSSIMQYNQPSFIETHSAPIIGYSPSSAKDNTTGGQPIRDFSYYPSKFYRRK